MRDEKIGFLPVCDEGLSVIGTLTDRDIAIRVVAEGESTNEQVGRFMTPDAITCRADDELSVAQDLMSEMKISRIVCVSDNGQLEGIISLSDIALLGDSVGAAETLRHVTTREVRQLQHRAGLPC